MLIKVSDIQSDIGNTTIAPVKQVQFIRCFNDFHISYLFNCQVSLISTPKLG